MNSADNSFWFNILTNVSQEHLLLTLEKLAQLFNLSPELMSITTLEEGIYIDVNQTFLDTLGYTKEEVIGQRSTEIGWWVTPADREKVIREIKNKGRIRNQEVTFRKRSGELGTGLWSVDLVNMGTETYLFSNLLDITDRKRMEESLRKSEELFRLLAENARDIIYRISLRPRKVDYISPSIQSITGYTPEEHYNDPWLILSIIHPDDRSILMKPAAMLNEDPIIIRWISREGKVIWTEQKNRIIYDALGQPVALEGISRDITERVLLEENLRHTSLHDALTSLYNRAYFEEEMRRIQNSRTQGGVAIIACDVDGLKLVNDVMGHEEGDRIIKAAAEVLENSFRYSDVVARVGGDEFAVLVHPATKALAQELCDRVAAGVDSYNQHTSGVPLGLSVGYAIKTSKGPGLDEVYRSADGEMYRHKMRNRKQYRQKLLGTMARLAERPVYNAAWDDHISKLKMISELLARSLRFSRKRTEMLLKIAEYHDIGEVALSPMLLSKEGKLTPSEWMQVQQHCENGYRIAQMVPELTPLGEAILCHHERWDGTGYPNGIKGLKIPLESRIIAIADAYSAMTCPRAYREAISEEAALDEIKNCAGSQFDPELVAKLDKALKSR